MPLRAQTLRNDAACGQVTFPCYPARKKLRLLLVGALPWLCGPLQHIAGAMDEADGGWGLELGELFAEVGDVDPEGVHADVAVPAPDVGDEFICGQDDAGGGEEHFEDLVFFSAESAGAIGVVQGAGGAVKGQSVSGQEVGGVGGATAQNGAQMGEKFGVCEGLCETVVGSGVQSCDDGWAAAFGEQQQRGGGDVFLAQLRDDGEVVILCQGIVEEESVVFAGFGVGEGVGGGGDAVEKIIGSMKETSKCGV